MEEKHIESLYCLMNNYSERKLVKSKIKYFMPPYPLPQVPKVLFDIPPSPDTGTPLCQLLL